MSESRYPHIHVQLSGEDGNAFFIIARVRRAMQRAGVESSEIALFTDEATGGDYDHLLQTVMKWVETS